MTNATVPPKILNQKDRRSFPKVMVINLERSIARWTSVKQSLENAGFTNYERIDAIDAQRLSKNEQDEAYDAEKNSKHYFAPLKPGEIACFLSHRKAWRTIIDENLDGAFVLEDDVIVRPSAVERMCDVVEFAAKSTPLIVKIYSKRPATGKIFEIGNATRLVEPILAPIGGQGAYINRPAAEHLLRCSQKFHEPVDVYLQRTWEHGVKIMVLPTNALDEASARLGGSTLSLGNPTKSARLRRELRRPIFRMMLYMHALLDRWSKKG